MLRTIQFCARVTIPLCLCIASFAQAHPFISFDAPDATSGTVPLKINASGQIAGFYLTNGLTHGFLRQSNGQFVEFDPPNSNGTWPVSINGNGQIVGYTLFSTDYYRGFLRSRTGLFVQIFFPGAHDTYPWSINDSAVITGRYTDRNGAYHGFIRDSAGVFTSIDVTGAGTERGQGTFPYAINNKNDVTGFYFGPSGLHGFLRDAGGNITTIDVADSISTRPQALNKNGDMAGNYLGNDSKLRGFVRHADGTVTSFNPPGSTSDNPTAITDGGYVCGGDYDSADLPFGFLRTPSEVFLEESGPQPNSGGYCQDINNSLRATGAYLDSSNITHGWIK